MIRLQSLRINPLGILSGAFMIIAPFGAWMTLSVFGFVSRSNLWQIANSQTSFPIGQNTASAAFYSVMLLTLAGIVSLRWARIGLPIGGAGVILFGVESYTTFGTFPGPFPVTILPGLGLFLALSGLVLGFGALRIGEIPLINILSSVRNRDIVGQAGVMTAAVFLAADGWNHWSDGQFSHFLGTTPLEGTIHRALFLGVVSLVMVFVFQRHLLRARAGGLLAAASFGALIADAIYHFTSGSIVGFVGNSALEIMLHALAYYGLATVVIARFLLKR